MKPVTCAQGEEPLMMEITAMMRRNSTSRRVQTLSSPSIRSDDIAADSMVSRVWSRGEVSDMTAAARKAEDDCQISAHGANSWPSLAAKSTVAAGQVTPCGLNARI